MVKVLFYAPIFGIFGASSKICEGNMNKKRVAKSLVFLAFIAVCIYTVWFGTIKNPVDYTMSTIGNYFDHRPVFILWGAVTGILLVACISYIYRAAGCRDISSDRFLAMSYAFLIMTVIVPNIKESSYFLFCVHVATSVLFAGSLIISIAFFMRHLYLEKRSLYNKALKLLILCVAIPLGIIAAYGKITSLAEMAFFVLVSVFFTSLYIIMAAKKKGAVESGLKTAQENAY